MKRFLRTGLVAACFASLILAARADDFSTLLSKAQGGDVDAMRDVSTAYEEGTDVGKNLVEALRWRKRAAEKDELGSDQLAVGIMYAEGKGTKPDIVEAVKWLQLAIAQDDVEASDKLAELKAADPQLAAKVKALAPAATKQVLAKAAQGDAQAQYDAAVLWIEGKGGLLGDPAEGARLVKLAAEQGLLAAQERYGEVLEGGVAGEPDAIAAEKWYRKAADRKDAKAQFNLGKMYADGRANFEKNPAQAEFLWRAAAAQHYPEAAGTLGFLYLNELHKPAEALVWFERAAEEGEGDEAAMIQAAALRAGAGDDAKARHWLELAVTKFKSQEAGARLEELGTKAAEAQFPGQIPFEVRGFTRGQYLRALQGDAVAQFQLGNAYQEGVPADHLPRNNRQAEKWWQRAAAQGNAEAKNLLENLDRRDSSRQLARVSAAFDEEFTSAPDLPGRKEAIRHLVTAIRTVPLGWAGANKALYALLAKKAQENPTEAGSYFLVLNQVEFKPEEWSDALPPDVLEKVRAYAHRAAEEFPKQQDALQSMALTVQRARADDPASQFALGTFYRAQFSLEDQATGVDWWRKAAANGSKPAQTALTNLGIDAYNAGGELWRHDELAKAVRQFRLASSLGVTTGELFIGIAYVEGVPGLPRNSEAAVRWMRLAAAHGDIHAPAQLADYLSTGLIGPKDPTEAFKLAQESANQGSATGQGILGSFYFRGVGVPADERTAVEWMDKALGKDHGLAQEWTDVFDRCPDPDERAELALQYAGATIVEGGSHMGQPLAWLEYSALLGNAEAKRLLKVWPAVYPGRIADRPELAAADQANTAKNYAEARRLYRQLAESGNGWAMLNLAVMNNEGTGQEADLAEASRWYEQAGGAGLLTGFVHVRQLQAWQVYIDGLAAYRAGRKSDAVASWMKAVSLGSADARLILGMAYETGDGVEPDETKALSWYLKSAALGSMKGRDAAMRMQTPLTPEQELAKGREARAANKMGPARQWYEKAAKHGSAEAMNELGLLYEKGNLGPNGIEHALVWYRQAAELGNQDAQSAVDSLTASNPAAAAAAKAMKGPPQPKKEAKPALAANELKKKAEEGDPQAQLDLAQACARDGAKDEAYKWFMKALKNPKVTEDIKKLALMGAAFNEPEHDGLIIVPNAPKAPPPVKSLSETELKAQAAAAQKERETKAVSDTIAQSAQKPKTESEKTADDYFSVYSTLALFGGNEQAIDQLHKAAKIAETGSPETRYRLATVIMQGIFATPKEPERAKALLVSSANDGFVAAKLAYAQALLTGSLGFAPDQAKGKAMLTEVLAGAEHGDNEVQYGSAMILFQGGYGVSVDRPRAVRLLTATADGGLRESQYELGRALITGIPPELPADPQRGVDLLRKAANQHKIEAVVVLGQVFEKGVGVPANPTEALFWYKKADDSGVPGAKEAVERVQKLVPPEAKPAAPAKKN